MNSFDEPAPSQQSAAAILGPADPTTFFDEQRRNRRATWRLALGCVFAIIVVGLPISLVLAPLLYGVTLIVINTINLLVPMPAIIEILRGVGNLAFAILDYLAGEKGATISPLSLTLSLVAWFAPGTLAMIMIWCGLYFFFRVRGIGAMGLSAGARPPRQGDLEEFQLGNLVTEMSLAAGITPPRLLLLDGDVVNAAAIGRSRDDAVLIVSRRLLDEYDRDETQGIIGHLIGSISNGDLDIAFWMTSVLLSFSLLVAILKAPFSVSGRTTFLRLIRLGLRGWRGGLDGAADKELVNRMINGNFAIEDIDDKRMPPLLVPFILASLAVQWTLFVLVPGLLQPFLALLWRKRRYLADATAVQLTRNPEGLARALLKPSWQTIPGGQGVAHLFLYGPVGSESLGDFFMWKGVGFHPTPKRRLLRLHALGAHVDLAKLNSAAPAQPYPVLFFAIKILLGLLMLVAAAACVAAIGLFVLVSMFIMGMFLMAIHAVFMAVGAVKGWIFG